MDARLSPEQRHLEDAAERLAANLGPRAVADLDDADRRARLGAALMQAGWQELRTGTPSEPVASGVEAAIVTRTLARKACDTAFVGPLLAVDLLRRAGADTDDDCRTVAVDVDLSQLAAISATVGTDRVLAIDAADSTAAVVLVSEGDEFSIAEVPLGSWRATVDVTRPVARVSADAPPRRIGRSVSTEDVTAWSALAVSLTAADLVGTMEGALVLATEYAKVRRQYGAPIGSYQAIQHMLAEAATLAEGALSAVLHAAWAVDALQPADARVAAGVAKAYASRAARIVCETAIQVHGGIGHTWECMAHIFLRRALLSTELFGNEAAQLTMLARDRWGWIDGVR